MSKLKDVLESIDSHCLVENRDGYQNLSIGRGELKIKGQEESKIVWVLNTEPIRSHGLTRDITGATVGTYDTGRRDFYKEGKDVAVSKNRHYARIILQHYEGNHTCVFANGLEQEFIIESSAHYINRECVCDIYVGISGMSDWRHFPTMKNAKEVLSSVEEDIEIKKKAEEEAKHKVEELRRKREEAAEFLAQAELKRIEEEVRIAEEEARKLKDEIIKAQEERDAFLQEVIQAETFIRRQVSLRRNPILDKFQDKAKFSNIYNGVAEIINGGPGTGKTTTMIQRLKLLIDREDLEDFIKNNEDCKLTTNQLDSIFSTSNNWIYFSPNDLLKKYLQDNMNYEGLQDANHRTLVWKDFLKDAVRDGYHIAGHDCPFDFAKKKKEDLRIYKGNHLEIVELFSDFYLKQIKEKFVKISKIEVSKFEWKILGTLITKECAKIESVKSLRDLISFLIHLEGLDKNVLINGITLKSGSEIAGEYNKDVKILTDKYIAILKRDSVKYDSVIEYIKSISRVQQVEVEDIDDVEEVEPDYGDLSIALFNKLNSLLKKMCLRFKDSSVKLSTIQKQMLEFVKDYIEEEELMRLSDSAYFVKYLNPALKGFRQYVLSSIPQYYKMYRKFMPEYDKRNWDLEILSDIIGEGKNRLLLSQEQALLVGFVNNIVKTLYKVNRSKFESLTHKYGEAYKNYCRPVIGIDEATDYCLIDFYGIKSFGHYEVCSFTLSGDVMQLMKDDGIDDWEVLKTPILFENIDIHNLKISYRQSAELLSLADKIYRIEVGKASPYKPFINNISTPPPLWLECGDMEEKAEWMSERVMEIAKVYNYVPTIAIFTIDKKKAEELKDVLEECDDLIRAGIDVKVCSDSTLEGEKTLRIFPINQVKGMEFEAVFFYDIDDLESTSLINRYLYVGLSRASMYLAVTSNGKSEMISDMLRQYFRSDNVTWGVF